MTAVAEPHTDVARIPAMAAGLRTAFESGITRPLEWRRDQLRAIIRMLEENEAAFADALRTDLGKPAIEGFIITALPAAIAPAAGTSSSWTG